MTVVHESPSSFQGALPEAPDDLRALDEQMPDVTNVYGTIPYQEASMSGDVPMQGTLPETPADIAAVEQNLPYPSLSGEIGVLPHVEPSRFGELAVKGTIDVSEIETFLKAEAAKGQDEDPYESMSGLVGPLGELIAMFMQGAEDQIPSVQGTLDGAENLPPFAESVSSEVQVPEVLASDEPAPVAVTLQPRGAQIPGPNQATTPNMASEYSSFSGTLLPQLPRRPQPPVSPQTEMFSIPAEPARQGLSAAKLNELLDSGDPADRARALAETRRQNQDDGTRIMPESLKHFTPADVNLMSEQQIHSITPKLARQMTREARNSVRDWQKYYHEKHDQIANATPERFTWIRENISRLYGRMTEGAKGAYQIRLVGDATPADLARINPKQLTVPDARKLYDERRRILEEQGLGF